MKKERSLSRKELIKRVDRLCQTCARYKGARKKGNHWVNNCVSCGQPVRCDKANGGHFCSRSCYPLRWDEKNVNCQCVHCNLYKNGAYIEYSQWFIKTYGEHTFNRYVDLYRQWQVGAIPAVKIGEIREKYDYWLEKGRALEKKVGPLFPKTWEKFGPDFITSQEP